MLLVGLTGGIGCGKSTAVKYFRSHDILLIDADEIARQVVEPGQSAYQKLRDEFGSTYFDDKNGGKLIREKLGDLVFNSPEVLLFYGDCCIICFFLETPKTQRHYPPGDSTPNFSSNCQSVFYWSQICNH